MRKKSLMETNPYLRDPEKRDKLLKRSVASSTAIEGVHAAARRALGLTTLSPSRQSKASVKPER